MTTPPPADPTPPVDPAPVDKTFTQAELNAAIEREKGTARRQAATQLAESLGMSVDDAKKALTQYAAAQDAQKTQAQRDAEALAAARAEAESAKADAVRTRHTVAVERELARAGLALPDDAAERDGALARAVNLVSVDPGADSAAVAAAVKALKKLWPGMFAAPKGAGSGDPGPGPRGGGKSGPAGIEAGRAAVREQAGATGRARVEIVNGRPQYVYDR